MNINKECKWQTTPFSLNDSFWLTTCYVAWSSSNKFKCVLKNSGLWRWYSSDRLKKKNEIENKLKIKKQQTKFKKTRSWSWENLIFESCPSSLSCYCCSRSDKGIEYWSWLQKKQKTSFASIVLSQLLHYVEFISLSLFPSLFN